jgi:hypothetical protein
LARNFRPFKWLGGRQLYAVTKTLFSYLSWTIRINNHGFFTPSFKSSNLNLVIKDHTNNNEYKINDFEFHAVFGCRTLTATVAIWFDKESDQQHEPRKSLLIKDRKVFTLLDREVDELVNALGATVDWKLIRFKLIMEFLED